MKHGFPLQDFTCYYNFLKCIEAKKKNKTLPILLFVSQEA